MNNNFTPEAIKALRKSLNLTQSKFARRLGVEVVTVSRWECGQRHPTLAMQRKLNRLQKRSVVRDWDTPRRNNNRNESTGEHK